MLTVTLLKTWQLMPPALFYTPDTALFRHYGWTGTCHHFRLRSKMGKR